MVLPESRKRDLREEMREAVEMQVVHPSQQEAARLRLTELARERSKAAEMAVKEMMPEDLFRQEIARIARETEAMERILGGDLEATGRSGDSRTDV